MVRYSPTLSRSLPAASVNAGIQRFTGRNPRIREKGMIFYAMLGTFTLSACQVQKPALLPPNEDLNLQADACPAEDFMHFNNVDDDHHR